MWLLNKESGTAVVQVRKQQLVASITLAASTLGFKRVENGQRPSAQPRQDINPRQLQIYQYTAALICPKAECVL